jgi:hypothetical protein
MPWVLLALAACVLLLLGTSNALYCRHWLNNRDRRSRPPDPTPAASSTVEAAGGYRGAIPLRGQYVLIKTKEVGGIVLVLIPRRRS